MMLLTLYTIAVLVGIAIAQHPDNWTPSNNEPSIPVLDCSARDASTSALASCTSHWDSSKTGYPDECHDLLFQQGLFHTCTTASPTSSSNIPTTKPTYMLMEGSTLATLTSTRVVTELAPAPPNIKAEYTYATATLDNSAADLLGPPYPVYKPGFPRPDCPGESFISSTVGLTVGRSGPLLCGVHLAHSNLDRRARYLRSMQTL